MSIRSGFQTFADAKIENVSLAPLIGAYQLALYVRGSASRSDGEPYWFIAHSGQVLMETVKGKRELCRIYPDAPQLIRQNEIDRPFAAEFKGKVLGSELNALEELRRGGDVALELVISGRSGLGNRENDWIEQQRLDIKIPQSVWIAHLKSSEFLDILLLEIPMPALGPSTKQKNVHQLLAKAQRLFVGGEWSSCILECRRVAEALQDPSESGIWTKLAKQETRKLMDKGERTTAILMAVQNFTHLAAHSDATAQAANLNRADAWLILCATAVLAARGNAVA